jgi:hypothetical protein
MKKLFELSVNGQFVQYLLPSEIRLLKWESGKNYMLTPIEMTIEQYNLNFGKN